MGVRLLMKLKTGFLLRRIAGQNVVIPADRELNLNLMITLNDTGAFLWERLQNETDEAALTAALLKEYDVDEKTAAASVAAFVEKVRKQNFME